MLYAGRLGDFNEELKCLTKTHILICAGIRKQFGIASIIAVSTMATTAIVSVGAFNQTYKSNYNYTYDGNSYAKMDYYEAGNFVQTRATNKQSLTEYPKISVDVYYSNGGYLDGASEYKTLSTKGSIGIKGCSNYRSSGGDNYKHTVTVYRDSSHTNKVATISKTVG